MSVIHKKHLSSFQIIIFGFAGTILLGTLLLMLPVSSAENNFTAFPDALFTSTSAVCVTGLVIHDTASYWSVFGHLIILLLIQTGGLGVVTVAAAIAMISGRKIGLMQRSTMQTAISASKVGGIVRLTGFILKATFLIEILGAVLMSPVFCREFGMINGLWKALFHSVSAFCNAGFDLMGVKEPFSSLTCYRAEPIVNTTVMLLIIVGGIGFLTWEDIRINKTKIRKYSLQSKVVLSTTLILILLPAVYFYFREFSSMSVGERILSSLFQSVTPRTAGFNTTDLTAMSGVGQAVIIILMLIGGSPGSTAGGMKTTTAAVLIFSAFSVFGRRDSVEAFGRRVPESAVKNAGAVLLMYISLFLLGGLVISGTEGLPVKECLFEAASAIGTVGLSLGITQRLGAVSRIILILLMFFGRVGGLTLIFAATSGKKRASMLPQEKITIG